MKKMLMVLLMLCLMCAGSAMAESVSYIERSWNGTGVTEAGKTADCTPVTGSDTTWESGWYVAQGNVTIDARVTVNGTANLILCDGAALTVNGGIEVGTGKTLVIYGQSGGTGALTASSLDDAGIGGDEGYMVDGGAGGAVTVHGGVIHASSNYGAGIGGGYGFNSNGGVGGNLTVYGGEVHASSDRYGAGIGGGSNSKDKGAGGAGGEVTVYGGVVYATGNYGAGIGGGGGRGVLANGGAGGTVTIHGGTVYASGLYGAGIGGGSGNVSSGSYSGEPGAGGEVTISGGVVYATGSRGAGIGGSCVTDTSYSNQGAGGNVTISGGTVYAASRYGISDGTTRGGFGIGTGYYERAENVNPNNQSLTISPQGGKAIVVKQGGKDADLDTATGSRYTVNGSIEANDRNKVFYAYTCDANNTGTYRLKFEANGGTGTMYPLRLPEGQATSLPSCGFTRTGYTFTGWNTQADGSGTTYMLGELVSDSDLQPGENGEVTLYAQWRPNTYTVRFRVNGGTGTMDDLACTYDQAQMLPENTFERLGYTFKGWSVGGELLPDEAKVMNLTDVDGGVVPLYAQWTANTYTVRFDKNAEDATGTMADQVLTYNKSQQLSYKRFDRTGYTFAGWNTEKDGSGTAYENGEKIKNLTTVNGGVVTLYAQWTANTYTVEFNANFGTGTMHDQDFTYDVEQALMKNVYTRTNYFFAGWNTEEDGSGAAYADGAKVKNLTADDNDYVHLHAQWQALPIEGNDRKVETQLLNEALTAEHLSGMPQGYNTMADVEAQMRGAAAQMGFLNGAQDGFIELRDVRLQQREKADGADWIDVPKENFPAAGLTVTLEIPEGADVLTHDFLVVHMFTQEMNGRLPGAMEAFTPAIGEDGLTVTLNGCSPVGILWRAKPVDASALPQTGDTSSLLGWVCLLAMCAGAALVMKRAKA